MITTRILLADDHEIVRDGLRTLLETQPGIKVVGEAADGHSVIELAARLRPDLIIMDLAMPGLNGIEATRTIVHNHPQSRVMILSALVGQEGMAEALKAGACGYLPKECAFVELTGAIRAVAAGKVYLSPSIAGVIVDHFVRPAPATQSSAFHSLTAKQRQVLQLVAEGKSNKEIGALLGISIKTVDTHRQQIMGNLNLHSVAELTKYAIREGLTTPAA